MQIIIPTRGRTSQQLTLQSLPPELRERTTIVCPKLEAVRLAHLYPDVEIVVEPYPMKIAQKREWIVCEWYRAGYEKVLMLDDDLRFATRISKDDTGLRTIWGEELIPEFERIEEKLGPEFPHVGFGPRQNNNNEEAGWKSPARMMYTLGYYLPIVKECRWDLLELREDFCVTLQLLLNGYSNAIWNTTVVDQKDNAPGGSSTWRTLKISDAEAERFQNLYPAYVRVEPRNYGTSLPRKEVVVQWKKALEDGRRKCRLKPKQTMVATR
jgi:hypothetical protein